jgi:hypothetical protein
VERLVIASNETVVFIEDFQRRLAQSFQTAAQSASAGGRY